MIRPCTLSAANSACQREGNCHIIFTRCTKLLAPLACVIRQSGVCFKGTCSTGDAVGRTPGSVGQLKVGAAPVHSVAALFGKQVLTQRQIDT